MSSQGFTFLIDPERRPLQPASVYLIGAGARHADRHGIAVTGVEGMGMRSQRIQPVGNAIGIVAGDDPAHGERVESARNGRLCRTVCRQQNRLVDVVYARIITFYQHSPIVRSREATTRQGKHIDLDSGDSSLYF